MRTLTLTPTEHALLVDLLRLGHDLAAISGWAPTLGREDTDANEDEATLAALDLSAKLEG